MRQGGTVIDRCRACAVLIFLIAASVTAADKSFDWNQWRGPQRDGVSHESGWSHNWPANGPRNLWEFDAGFGMCSVATRGDRVFTMGNVKDSDLVYCLDARTGNTVWQYRYAERREPRQFPGGPAATPTVIGGRVYTFSRSGQLHCLDEGTGTIRWQKDLRKVAGSKPPRWGFASSPLIVGNRVFVNIGRSGAALDTETGKLLWRSPEGKAGFASAVPVEKPTSALVVFFTSKALWAVHQADGRAAWNVPWPTDWGENTADPVPVGDKLYFSSAHGRGAALLQLTNDKPEFIWRNEKFENHVDTAVLWDEHLYGFSGRINRRGGSLLCVDFKTGKTRWAREGLKGSLNIADGKLLIMTLKGKLVIAKATPKKYEELSTAQVLEGKCWTPPVLSNDRLYCRSGEGKLLCLDVRKP
jgi:outer membrane protein assembly factor BamB